MDIRLIAARVAKYNYQTKAKLNAFVISEIAQLAFGHKPTEDDFNKVAEALLESPLHRDISTIAEDMDSEVDRITKLLSAP